MAYSKFKAKKNKTKMRKQVKREVRKIRAKKVELKDRISTTVTQYDMYQNGPTKVKQESSVTAGLANTYVIVPSSYIDPFSTGTQNGQIIGTEITPKYLNCKVKLGFDFLRRVVYLDPNGNNPHVQRYDINIIQGWIKKDLREHIDKQLTNVNSGWELPSFESKAVYVNSLSTLIQQEMFNNGIKPEFLSYRQKTASNILILKRIKVKGQLDENLVTQSDAASPADSPASFVTPEQNFTFNWDLSKLNKTKLTPVGTGTATPTHVFGYSWIPFIQVSVARRVEENRLSVTGGVDDPTAHRSYLTVKHLDHFTYADS